MAPTSPVIPAVKTEAHTAVWVSVLLVAVIVLTYANALPAPFVFDDEGALQQNTSLHHLSTAFCPPTGQGNTVGGRPVLNASFALNGAVTGFTPASLRLGNLAIHALASITLFLLVRHVLRRLRHPDREAGSLAAAVALLWAVHPLQTEAVTYLSQRAESLLGLFFLLTLYGFSRYSEHRSPAWFGVTAAACFLGAGTKEVMAAAPLVVFLFDRTFVSGSFPAAWKMHRRLHLVLASSWLLLGLLVVLEKGRGGSLGTSEVVGWWACVATQPVAILRYLGLAFWPAGQVFDYGTYLEPRWYVIIGSTLVVFAGLAATAVAMVRRPGPAFVALSFFLILAPSSSVVPIATQTVAEHRMYLPLAAVIVFTVLMARQWLGRHSLWLWVVLVPVLAVATASRNHVYLSEETLWADTVAKLPGNERAHNNLAAVLAKAGGRDQEAQLHYEIALRLRPTYATAHANLGLLLEKSPNTFAEALAHLQRAVQIDPRRADFQVNLGRLLQRIPGRESEALAHYEAALQVDPANAVAHNARASLLLHDQARTEEALAEFEEAVSLNPEYAEARFAYATALARRPGREAAARLQFQAALRAKPDYAAAHNGLGNLWSDLPGHGDDAVAEYEAALALDPAFAEAHCNLGNALMAIPARRQEAIAHYEQALRLKPDRPEIQINLARALAMIPGRIDEAPPHLRSALALDEKNTEAHLLLGEILLSGHNNLPEAIFHLRAAAALAPNRAEIHNNLGIALARTGDLRGAAESFDRARTLDPSLREASENYEAVIRALGLSPSVR